MGDICNFMQVNAENTEKSYAYSNDFQISTQMKSWMAINPSYGCPWDCVYCIQHKDKFFDMSQYRKVHKVKIEGELCTPEDIVTEIMINPRITSRTPIVLYNFTDPFLPQNTRDLENTLSLLDKRKFTNIIGLITRTFADTDTLDVIADLKYLRPIVMVSYAGYDNVEIERGPLNKRIELVKELKDRKIKTLQYLRPIAKEWLEEDQFKKARDAIGHLVDGVVMSGIRLTPEIIAKINARRLPVPEVTNFTNKFFPKDLQEKIMEIYQGFAPVYRYTSCAVSSTFGVPDYNAHLGFFKETQNKEFVVCPLPCNGDQTKICNNISFDESRFKSLLKRIGHPDLKFARTTSGAIMLDKELSKYDLSFLRHNTSCHIDYIGNKHHIDQVINMEVQSQK
ncbi:MAG: radical SAM protein [Nanoarchaeota archaeon]|nr:radical SAM protein [Nanoarchaeota archaeon]